MLPLLGLLKVFDSLPLLGLLLTSTLTENVEAEGDSQYWYHDSADVDVCFDDVASVSGS